MDHGSGSTAPLDADGAGARTGAFGRQAFDLPERRNRLRGRRDVRLRRCAGQRRRTADRAVARLPRPQLQRGARSSGSWRASSGCRRRSFRSRRRRARRARARGPAHDRVVANAAREHLAPALHPSRARRAATKAPRRFSPAQAETNGSRSRRCWAADCIRGFHFRELHHFWLTFRNSYTVRKWPMLRNLLWKYGAQGPRQGRAARGRGRVGPPASGTTAAGAAAGTDGSVARPRPRAREQLWRSARSLEARTATARGLPE